jgi:hypothetical protein
MLLVQVDQIIAEKMVSLRVVMEAAQVAVVVAILAGKVVRLLRAMLVDFAGNAEEIFQYMLHLLVLEPSTIKLDMQLEEPAVVAMDKMGVWY